MSNQEKQVDALVSNAEYQRRRSMTRDERAIDARDRVAKDLHEQNQKDGKRSTYEQCQRKMAEIAERAERDRK
jgi:hypothetical protein